MRSLTVFVVSALALVLLAAPIAALAAPPKYHLQLEANPGAPFPFLGKFGTVDIDVYTNGVHADTVWLDGFSRNGQKSVTVMNPLGRVYTEIPVSDVSRIVMKMSRAFPYRSATGQMQPPVSGTVRGIDATRYRLQYGPQAWIDIWTIHSIPDNPQFRALVEEFVSGITPAAAAAARTIPGVPVYVELNFSRFRKLPLLRMKSLTFDDSGAADALTVGPVYFRAPLLESIWK